MEVLTNTVKKTDYMVDICPDDVIDLLREKFNIPQEVDVEYDNWHVNTFCWSIEEES